MAERIDNLNPDIFLDGPTEYLVKVVAEKIKAVPEFVEIFGEYIDNYPRMDYPIRGLPAMRIYNNRFVKEYESWFINGDLTADVIFPASIRRNEMQQIQDTISSAVLQQFRRPSFFVEVNQQVPGLNELGKRFEVDKSRGFEWGDNIVPLTQITLNFRLDLREWDLYLEQSNRTKDRPFERTLGDLRRLVTIIEGLRDDQETVEVELSIDQKTT